MKILVPRTERLTNEERFLEHLFTPEGVEDFCILILASKDMDYDRLFMLAKEKGIESIVGCYLEILYDFGKIIPEEVVEHFYKNSRKRKRVFLKQMKKYGKEKWVKKYDEKWNLDLYLSREGIMHGVRSIS